MLVRLLALFCLTQWKSGVGEDLTRRRIAELAQLSRLDVMVLEAMNQDEFARDAESRTRTGLVSSKTQEVVKTVRPSPTLEIAVHSLSGSFWMNLRCMS